MIVSKALTRRQFLARSAIVSVGAIGAGGVGFTGYVHSESYFDRLDVTRYTIQTAQWPKNAASLRVAFISDFHVGCMSVPLEKLDSIVAQVNALDADIILLGGDFLTGQGHTFGNVARMEYVPPQPIAEKLKPLTAPLGVFAVLGNHDWACDGKGMTEALEQVGIRVLENNITVLNHHGTEFQLVGLADYLSRRPDVPAVMNKRNHNLPSLILAHDPYVYFATEDPFLAMLSGHTHGGQVRLPFIGPVVSPTPGMPLDMLYGSVGRDDAPLIVTSGVGTSSLPVKNTPCEMVLLEISAVSA